MSSYKSCDLTRIAQECGEDYFLDPQLTFETITNSIRNVLLYRPTKFKIELFHKTEDPHHQQRFARRVEKFLPELIFKTPIPTAEDVVIQKIRWQRLKDVDDAKNIIQYQFESLDWEYLRRWTNQHGTTDILEELREEAEELLG